MIIECYRGQHGLQVPEIQSKLPSITFGSQSAARLYASVPNQRGDSVVKSIVLSATIQIENSIINNSSDCFADFSFLIDKLGEDFMWYIADKFQSCICTTNNWEENYADKFSSISELKAAAPKELQNLYMDAYILLDDDEFVAQAKKQGYDGAIYVGNGETAFEREYRIFSKNQIIKLEEVKCQSICQKH